MTRQTFAQRRAVEHVRVRAQASMVDARTRVAEVLARAGAAAELDLGVALTIGARARVTLSFHPDRLLADGRTVAGALLEDGRYKSQFETGVSNGSRTAFAGGARDGWEEKLFGRAYHDPPAAVHERPTYGALDVMQHADGGSPRFGSCYLVLRREVNARCTFTWGDSHLGPEHVGTSDAFDAVLAAMLESAEVRGEVLAVRSTVPELARTLSSLSLAEDGERAVGRALDDYIEAQVHGPVELSRDVEMLAIDPAHDATPVGASLRQLGVRHGFATRTHPGFALAPHEVSADFRGPRMPALAERVWTRYGAGRPTFDAATLGRAAASLHRDPAAWQDWDTPEETLQHLKQLWHVLVRFGHAAD